MTDTGRLPSPRRPVRHRPRRRVAGPHRSGHCVKLPGWPCEPPLPDVFVLKFSSIPAPKTFPCNPRLDHQCLPSQSARLYHTRRAALQRSGASGETGALGCAPVAIRGVGDTTSLKRWPDRLQAKALANRASRGGNRVEAAQPKSLDTRHQNRTLVAQAAAVHATRSACGSRRVSAFLNIAGLWRRLAEVAGASVGQSPTRPGVRSCDKDQLIEVVGSTYSRGVDAAAS